MEITKILGWVLLSLPFAAITALIIKQSGVWAALFIWAILAAIFATIVGGVYLIGLR